MSFEKGHTTFGFTMQKFDSDEAAVDDLFASHAAWMAIPFLKEEEGNFIHLNILLPKRKSLQI